MSTATISRPSSGPAARADDIDVAVLRSRAHDLRRSADGMAEPVAAAFQRRASELELQATALAARLGIAEPLQLAA